MNTRVEKINISITSHSYILPIPSGGKSSYNLLVTLATIQFISYIPNE